MLFRLLILFIVVPLVELAFLDWLSDRTSLWATVLIVLVTGFAGAALARRQGLETWRRIHRELATGQTPAADLLDGVLILLAGAVLITPGLITDACGFALLIPAIRQHLRRWITAWFRARTFARFQQLGTPLEVDVDDFDPTDVREDVIVDVDFARLDSVDRDSHDNRG